jgi:hypothetical protein
MLIYFTSLEVWARASNRESIEIESFLQALPLNIQSNPNIPETKTIQFRNQQNSQFHLEKNKTIIESLNFPQKQHFSQWNYVCTLNFPCLEFMIVTQTRKW